MSESTRARRFSLPDLADERVDESIRSFLNGPEHRRGRRASAAPVGAAGGFASLETRIAWTEALRREAARSVRYRRPAAVMVIAAEATVGMAEAGRWVARIAGPIAHAIRRGVRETDLVTRTADARFQVLMPETTGPEAAHVAERVAADCEIWLRAFQAPVRMRVSTAPIAADGSPDAALERAVREVEAARPA